MRASIGSFVRRPRARAALMFVACVLAPQMAFAAPKAPPGPPKPPPSSLDVSLTPSSARAGSANELTFTFTSTVAGSGTASILVPPSTSKAPWSAPQVSNSTLTGYVAVRKGSVGHHHPRDPRDCHSAGPASVSGNTILVKFKCAQGEVFKVVYGAGNAKATAAQLVGPYTFTTQVNGGAGYLPTAVQPLVTVNPGPANNIAVGFSPTLAGYPTPSLPAFPGDRGLFTSCGAQLSDAYGNVVPGNLAWTSTDPYAKLPGCSTSSGCGTPVPVQIYFGCMFGTQGLQTVTVTDPVSGVFGQTSITVIGPIAHPDKLAIVDPTHNGTSLYTIDPMDNDDQTSGLTGNILLGLYTNTIKEVTLQPGYTDEHGVRHQVGVMKPTADGSLLAWEMNPPSAITPQPDIFCPAAPTTTVCHIPVPLTAAYTITDGVNVSAPVAITITMDTPADTPPVIPTVINAIFIGGNPTSNGSAPITVSTPGNGSIQIPMNTPATKVEVTPTATPSTYLVSMSYKPEVVSGQCDLQHACPDSVTLTGTAVVPDSFVVSTSGSAVSAIIKPPLQFDTLQNLWQVGFAGIGTFGPTGFLPVTLIQESAEPGEQFVTPLGYASLFGPMITSCQAGSFNTDCPKPKLDLGAPGGNVLADCLFGGATGTPVGQASLPDTPLTSPVPITVDLSFGTSDVSGTITVTIFNAFVSGTGCSLTGPPQWSSGFIVKTISFPVTGNKQYTTTWDATPGDYIVGALYSGDQKNSTSPVNVTLSGERAAYFLFSVE